jgi:hypothetical protein
MTDRDREYLRCLTRALKLGHKESTHDEWRGVYEARLAAFERLQVSEEDADKLEAEVVKRLLQDGWSPT